MRYGDPRASMWAEACEMLEQAERLQRQFFRPAGAAARPAWEPPADVFENEAELSLVIALPGVAPDNVKIVVEGGALTVTGARQLPRESRDGVIHRVEIPHGRFERRFVLPRGRFELRERELRDGCLTLKLRKLG
jgi:HSP20 family protein